MRAFVFDKYKQPAHEADIPEPTVGDQDVLIRVEGASLNHLDERIRSGEFTAILPYKPPVTLGHDVAGTVIRTGRNVSSFRSGDRVYARPRDFRIGTFAERVAVDQAEVALAPTSIPTLEAASLPLVALTAWQALVDVGNVQSGQKALIHAGAGGVGSIAIQLAKHLGATVATTVSAKDADFVRGLGADVVIDYRAEDFGSILSGYDFVLDPLGAESVQKSLTVVRPGGKVVGISGPPTPAFARMAGLNPIVRLAVSALSRKTRAAAKKLGVSYEFLWVRASGDQLRQIAELVDAGALRPIVGATFPFDRTLQALESLGVGSPRGKTVIDMSGLVETP